MIDLEACLESAVAAGARSILLISGQPLAMRIGETVETPHGSSSLTFHDTQAVVEQILPPTHQEALDRDGAVEFPFRIGPHRGTATVFFGQGAHNIVLHLGL
jgi:Tfp pilus assembly pilus retraction ATPase PilT